ncbi:MAG: ribosome biogenesis GTPase Der [Verrucomicrobiota bacterium]|nr:ribosome biogenesis GTPase Der [Verrucomicrobiota bacterium]
MAGLIAIVGRPNVGKSALFNRIVGRRIAIVHDEPGVTRDRVAAEAEWRGKAFTLVDTGGIGLLRGEKSKDVITNAAVEQVQLAIEEAAAIIFVVNVQEGITPLDREVAQRLRVSGKPVLVAVNKVDNSKAEGEAVEFSELGFEQVFPVTAIHGYGIERLVNAAVDYLPEEPEPEQGTEEIEALKLAIVGRPNVGKSSIINALTRSDRVIVSPIAGTTRDAVDVPFEVNTEGRREKYILIDTAGVRQERRVDNSIEFFSVKRTEDSIARADIVVFVIDAEAGITAQDKKIGGKIQEERKACIIVINKWDLVSEDILRARKEEIARRDRKEHTENAKLTTLHEFAGWVQEQLFFMDYAPVIFTSAKSGFHLDRLLEAVRYVSAQLQQQIPTSLLNRTLNDAIERRQPVSSGGHRLKFFYATQVRKAPPTFLLFVNKDDLFSDAYNKYLAGQLRKSFGYEGCPILLVPKPRPKTVQPIRKFKTREQPQKKGKTAPLRKPRASRKPSR